MMTTKNPFSKGFFIFPKKQKFDKNNTLNNLYPKKSTDKLKKTDNNGSIRDNFSFLEIGMKFAPFYSIGKIYKALSPFSKSFFKNKNTFINQ